MKKNGLLSIALVGFLFTSCGDNSEKKADVKTDADSTKVESTLPKVDVVTAKTQLFEHFFETQGNLEAEKMAIITPENGGKVTSIKVKEGQKVAAGTIIAVFDQSVIASNIKELDKNLELAKYMYEKTQTLYDQGVGTEVQLKQAKTQYEALKQTKESLNTQAGKFILKAPYSGYIEEIFVIEGEVASPMTPIVRIINTDNLKVTADISEVYLKNITNNTTVDVVFPAIEDTLKNIKINRLGKFINTANRTINIEISIPTKPNYIPNLMSILQVRDYVDTAALVVPTKAILEDNKGNAFVFLIDSENKANKIFVMIGKSYNGLSTIDSGLKSRDKIVINGARKLVDKQEIEIEKSL